MPAYSPDPEEYNPLHVTTWKFPVFDISLPQWLEGFSGLRLCNGSRKRNKKMVPWWFTISGDGNGGTINLGGGDSRYPSFDGCLRGEWNGSLYEGRIRVFVGLNQRRLSASSGGLLKDLGALALDLSQWSPHFPDRPGRIERKLLDLQSGAREFILQRADFTELGRAEKKLTALRDDDALFKERDLTKDGPEAETQTLRAIARCFKSSIQKQHLEPPRRKEVEFMAGKTCPEFAKGKNPGSISYMLGHLGFGWI